MVLAASARRSQQDATYERCMVQSLKKHKQARKCCSIWVDTAPDRRMGSKQTEFPSGTFWMTSPIFMLMQMLIGKTYMTAVIAADS